MSDITYPPELLPLPEPGDEVEVIVVTEADWRPISTAPTEHGARFLVWDADVGHVICERFGPHIVLAWNQEPYPHATHWMPLPLPPQPVPTP